MAESADLAQALAADADDALPAEILELPTRDIAARARALRNETKFLRK